MKDDTMKEDEEISILIDRLGDSDRNERLKARNKLLSMGKSVLPAITCALFNIDENIRWQAAKILSDLHEPSTAPALVKVLADDENFGVRWLAAEGLISMKSQCIEPILQGLIHRPDSVWLRQGAHHILHSLHDYHLTDNTLDNILSVLEGKVPSVEILMAAHRALKELELHRTHSG